MPSALELSKSSHVPWLCRVPWVRHSAKRLDQASQPCVQALLSALYVALGKREPNAIFADCRAAGTRQTMDSGRLVSYQWPPCFPWLLLFHEKLRYKYTPYKKRYNTPMTKLKGTLHSHWILCRPCVLHVIFSFFILVKEKNKWFKIVYRHIK